MRTQPQPVAGHTPGEDWQWEEFDHGFCLVTKEKGRGLENDCEMICQGYMGKDNARLIASAPRLARENEALRKALKICGDWFCLRSNGVENGMQMEPGDVARIVRAALTLSGQAVLTPKTTSDAAPGQPEGKEGVL